VTFLGGEPLPGPPSPPGGDGTTTRVGALGPPGEDTAVPGRGNDDLACMAAMLTPGIGPRLDTGDRRLGLPDRATISLALLSAFVLLSKLTPLRVAGPSVLLAFEDRGPEEEGLDAPTPVGLPVEEEAEAALLAFSARAWARAWARTRPA